MIPQTYYLDGLSLSSSSAIFLDIGLTICAPDGYYSNGSITRQLVGCRLLPQQYCLSCGVTCGEFIELIGEKGVYLLNLDTGTLPTEVGAIVIHFDPLSTPDGIIVTYDGVTYNSLSSPIDGFHQSTIPNTSTYVGNDFSLSTLCPILISGGSTIVNEYLYDGSAFNATGNTQGVTVNTGQVSLTTGANPGTCVMVIPKPNPTPSIVNVQITGICGSTTRCDFQLDCPTTLTAKLRTTNYPVNLTPVLGIFCADTPSLNFYSVPVSGTSSILNLFDWVFQDQYGTTVLVDGWYKVSSSITIDEDNAMLVENGVIVGFNTLCGG